MPRTNICFIHPGLQHDTVLDQSFNDTTYRIRYRDSMTPGSALDTVGQQDAWEPTDAQEPIDLQQITNLAFIYHYPGHCRVPFFDTGVLCADSSGD